MDDIEEKYCFIVNEANKACSVAKIKLDGAENSYKKAIDLSRSSVN